jgi:hypothetical protein
MSGPQSRSGRFGEEKNLLALPGIEPRFFGRQTSSLVTIPTALSGLQENANRHQCEKDFCDFTEYSIMGLNCCARCLQVSDIFIARFTKHYVNVMDMLA